MEEDELVGLDPQTVGTLRRRRPTRGLYMYQFYITPLLGQL